VASVHDPPRTLWATQQHIGRQRFQSPLAELALDSCFASQWISGTESELGDVCPRGDLDRSSASRAWARRSSTRRLGTVPPASNPATADWVIPAAAAS
jgi:hypothetical protein